MKRILSFTAIFALMLLFSCSEEDVETQAGVFIRIENVSDFEYRQVEVNTSGGKANYGIISSGSTSAYQRFDYAYRYAAVELKIEGNKLRHQPFDYVGETRLSNGYYTYQIGVEDLADGTLSLTLKR